jgi:alpha-L-rhamnosidase
MITRRNLLAGMGVAAAPKSKPKSSPAAAFQPANLLCEYLENPLGIDETLPRLSWELRATSAKAQGLKQSAYRILVASSPELLAQGKGDRWDSGRVESGQSVHVVYAGAPLVSRARCYWKVRAWDQDGKASEWSEPGLWTMGLLAPDDWSGYWIGLDEPAPQPEAWLPGAQWIWYPEGNPRQNAPVGVCHFRRTFELPAGHEVKSAQLYLAADDRCSASLNGVAVGEGSPVRTDDCWKRPEPIDVKSRLRSGENVLSVEAENTRWKPFTTPEPASRPAGLIGVLRVRFEDGLEWTLPTGRDWQVARATAPDRWLSAMELGAFGVAPWNRVNPEEYRTLPVRMLRREFTVPRKLRRATAYVCGLGYFEFYLNGRRAGDHVMEPVMSDYDRKVHYVTFDVTGMLKEGRNAAGLILGNGPFFSYRKRVPAEFRTFGYPKALVNVRLEFEDGTFEDFVTDRDWKITTGGPIRANNEYDGEIYDARREQAGWAEPGFDESRWRPAQLVEAPAGRLRSQMLEPLRVTETLRPVSISEPRPGVFVVDFGQTYNGWVRLRVNGPAGTEVRLCRAGTLRPDGMVRKEDSRSALMTDIYTLSGRGEEVWTPRFTSQGGRYLEVTGFPGRPTAANFEGLVIHTDMRPAGSFECSNSLLNRLYSIMRWSQRIEARGVPLDISSRDERMPWISEHHGMDGHGFAYRAAAMYANWLEDIRISQRANGSIPNVAPSFWTFGEGVVWPVTLVYLPEWFHRFYGDRRAIERSYPAVKRLVRFMRDAYMKPDGTFDFNDHGDWLDATTMDGATPDDGRAHPFVGATPQPLISTAFYYFYCTILERHARMLGRGEDAAEFSALGEKVRAGFLRRFTERKTQTSRVLPLAFGIIPERERAAEAKALAGDVMLQHDGHTTCGFMGVQWILTVLSETGHHEAAYRIATQTTRPSWGYMASKGATTMWERWDHDTADPTMTGESQYFLGADIVGWLFRTLAGINIDPERPGFQHILLRPQPAGDLKWVKAQHHSLYGPITSEWELAGGKFVWNVSIPPNTTATAHLPGGEVRELVSGAHRLESKV